MPRYWATDEVQPPSAPETLQHFLLERYYFFVAQTDGSVFKGQVHHRPYTAYSASVIQLNENVTKAAGIMVDPEQMVQAYWSPGVEVTAYGPWQVQPAINSDI